MAIKTFKRVEAKYILNDRQQERVVKKALEYMNFDKYCVGGKKYSIYNIYYDTANDDLIRHSVSKPYYKEKLRLRSYKPFSNFDDSVYLELKKKIGGTVSKRRTSIKLGDAIKFIANGKMPETQSYIDGQVDEEIAFFLRNNKVFPKTFISYDRMAFFGKEDSEFRLTFDSMIMTRRSNLFFDTPILNSPLLDTDKYLMEIKITGSMPLWLSHELSEIGAYKTGFSKYGTEYKTHLTPPQTIYTYVPAMPYANASHSAGAHGVV